MKKDECPNCLKEKEMKETIMLIDGYFEFCSKKCAKEWIIKNWRKFLESS